MWSSTSLSSQCDPRADKKPRRALFVQLFAPICVVLLPLACTRQLPRQPGSPVVAPAGESQAAPHTSNPGTSVTQTKVRNSPHNIALRLALANEYFSAGETFAGIEQLEVARALSDTDSSLLRDLANNYDSVGEPEVAAVVLASGKGRPELALPLSRIYLKLGDFQRSVEALRPLLKNRAALPIETQQTIMRAFLLAGDAETAARLLPHAQSDAEWQALAGLQALIAGKPKVAVAALRKALALNPRDEWNGYLLGRACLAAGDSKQALAAWSDVLDGQDPPPGAVIGTAELLARTGRLDEADGVLDRIRGEDRKLPSYWRTAALVAGKRKHTAISQISLGYAAYNEGDPWKAEALWLKALPQADAETARQIYAALSNSATRSQDGQAALSYAAAAVRRWPRDPAGLRQYAETLLAQNQLADALAAARQFQAVAPPEQQARAAELLSRIALDSSRPELLQQNAGRNRALAPTDAMPLLHLAEWQGQQGHDPANLERTLELYRTAQSVSPTNAEATARAGLILADLKRVPEAITTLLHALTLNPRVLDGSPNALLTQLYAREGETHESRYEARQYERVHALKETWPSLLKTMRQEHPTPGSADWQALGEMALRRHENWIALCAFTRRVRLATADPRAWLDLAATQKRLGWFDEALGSMRRAHLLSSEKDEAFGSIPRAPVLSSEKKVP